MRARPDVDQRPWARIGAAAVLALGTLWTEGAGAAELELIEPSPCVTRDELSFRVERAIHGQLADAPAIAFRVTAERISPRALEAELEISAPIAADSGSRTFRAASCDELLDRVALAMALALGSHDDDTRPAAAAAAKAPPFAPEVEVTAAPAPDAPSPLEEHDAGESSAHFVVRAGFIGDTGTLPRAGVGVGGGAGLRWPSFELLALGAWLPRREGSVQPSVPDSPGARVGLVAGSLLGCVPLGTRVETIELGVCAGWELGRLAGVGTHVDEARHQASLWSAARLDLRAEWSPSRGPLGLALSLGAVAPLTRDEFIVRDIGSVYRPANVIGRAGLGLSWALD